MTYSKVLLVATLPWFPGIPQAQELEHSEESTQEATEVKPGTKDLVLRVPTAPATLWNQLQGWKIREPITVEYLGKPCTLPVTYHPHVSHHHPTLLLHGMTDTGESFQPLIKYLGRRRNQHFIVMDWPLNGKANCPQAKNIRQVAEAIDLVYQAFQKHLNRERPQEPPLEFPSTIFSHSMGDLAAVYLKKKPAYAHTKLVLTGLPLLREYYMMELTEFVSEAQTAEAGADFLQRVRTPGGLRMLDLAQEAPILKSLVVKPLTGSAHLVRMKRAQSLLTTLFESDPATREQHLPRTLYDDVKEALLSLDPAQVTVILGKKDMLTPPRHLPLEVLKKFRGHILLLNCGHNIQRDCYKKIPKPLLREGK